MRTGRKIVALIICLIVVAWAMPFITTLSADDQGNTWRVPFGSRYVTSDETSVTFQNMRSAYATGHDAENALNAYEEVTCYGNTYYYDETNDISYTGYETSGFFPTKITYYYEQGNTCKGWTVDDEIAWEDGDPLEIDPYTTPDEAMQNGWIVIQDGQLLNIAQYHDFSRMVKQGVLSMQRAILYTGDSFDVIDVQVMSDASIKVTRVIDGEKTIESYGRYTEAEIDGVTHAVVYHGANSEEAPTVLYICQE